MVPDWLISRLSASDMQRLADLYRGMATYLADRAQVEARVEAARERHLKLADRRVDRLAERNRTIWRLYQAGRSDAEIGQAVHLTARSVQRVIRSLLTRPSDKAAQRAKKRPLKAVPEAALSSITRPQPDQSSADACAA